MAGSGMQPKQVDVRGQRLLADPTLNKGTAFTLEERDAFGLHGLLPTHVETIEQRADRVRSQLEDEPTPLGKHMLLRSVQDTDETLFLRVMLDDIYNLLPIVYTPTVGEACQQFSRIYQHHRGPVHLLPRHRPHRGHAALGAPRPRWPSSSSPTASASSASATRAPTASASRSASSRSTRRAAASTRPRRCRSCSTSAPTTRSGATTPTTSAGATSASSGQDYDRFIEAVVQGVMNVYPDVLLPVRGLRRAPRPPAARPLPRPALHLQRRHPGHGHRRPRRHALRACASPTGTLKDQKIVIVGAGSAGSGIAEQIVAGMVADGLSDAEARARFFMVDRPGAARRRHGRARAVPGAARPAALGASTAGRSPTRPPSRWSTSCDNAEPSVLIGVTGVFGLFTEEVDPGHGRRQRAAHHLPAVEPHVAGRGHRRGRPRLDRRAGHGRHRQPLRSRSTHGGITYTIAQSNNSYIFPGIGLGVRASKATRVSDEMFMAAAHALAEHVDARNPGDSLLPPLVEVRDVEPGHRHRRRPAGRGPGPRPRRHRRRARRRRRRAPCGPPTTSPTSPPT